MVITSALHAAGRQFDPGRLHVCFAGDSFLFCRSAKIRHGYKAYWLPQPPSTVSVQQGSTYIKSSIGTKLDVCVPAHRHLPTSLLRKLHCRTDSLFTCQIWEHTSVLSAPQALTQGKGLALQLSRQALVQMHLPTPPPTYQSPQVTFRKSKPCRSAHLLPG